MAKAPQTEAPIGTAQAVDAALDQLGQALTQYLSTEASKGHTIPEGTLRKRLFLAIRAHDILPRRKAISQDDDFQGMLDPIGFAESEYRFEPWATPAMREAWANAGASK